MTEHALSPLDQAHAHRLEGHEEVALRLALACARSAPDAPGPMALIARVLVEREQPFAVSKVAERLVDAFVRRGDLPSAVVASTIALDAGEPHRPLLKRIATAFAKDAVVVGGSVHPPPFPGDLSVPADLGKLAGEPLITEAKRTLEAWVALPDPVADEKKPDLPLFGTLHANELEQLLSAVRVEEVSSEHEIVRQDDPGNEAFVLARGALNVVRRQGADETVLAKLGPGAIFGEMALISESPRSASVIALEPAQLLVLARDELERAAQDAPALSQQLSAYCHGRMQANLVRTARVLSGLSEADRVALLPQLDSVVFEPGQLIIERDQEAAKLLKSFHNSQPRF